jgi:uncharacterized protein related to proFAR isomerase
MTLDVWPAMEVDVPRGRGARQARDEAAEAVREAAADHERVYLVDRQGVQRNKPDVELVQRVADEAEIWVDAGPRYAEDVVDLFIAGARHVVVRWHTLDEAQELGAAADMSGDISLGAEFQGKSFLENPREAGTGLETLLDRIRRLDLDLTVIGHPGEQGKVAPRHHAHAVRGFDGRKWYMGPVSGDDDRDRLGEEGFTGAFVDWSSLGGDEVWDNDDGVTF